MPPKYSFKMSDFVLNRDLLGGQSVHEWLKGMEEEDKEKKEDMPHNDPELFLNLCKPQPLRAYGINI